MRAISAATGKIWISIHVLRVEDDPAAAGVVAHGIGFQSTSSVWRTTRQKTSCAPALTFQSTSSVWRTTACRPGRVCKAGHFNPRPPCGGRRLRSVRQIVTFLHFNPRPPCGGRQSALRQSLSRRPFQSTSSVWRTTEDKVCADSAEPFQSTSSVWRTTGRWAEAQIGRVDFNPRPPCGGRQTSRKWRTLKAYFNPRPPCGGRPSGNQQKMAGAVDFNPRPPCGGRPRGSPETGCKRADFNPRPPCGGRLAVQGSVSAGSQISIHVLRVEDDGKNREKSLFALI